MKKLIFLIAIALVLSACNSNSPHAKKLNDLEKKYNAHIGVYALDTKSGKEVNLIQIRDLPMLRLQKR